MSTLMTLELHFPSNWACEGSVDVLYLDTATGNERSYGQLSQGAMPMLRETYPGHTWIVRENVSRELLMSIVASPPAGGGPQIVSIGGSSDTKDPLKASVFSLGKAPRELLLKTVELLSKVLANVLKDPSEPKYRSLRAANEKIAAALDLPGTLSFLGCAGFEQSLADGEAKLVLPASRPLAPVESAAAQLKRLDALLKGLPPPSESTASLQAAAAATTAASAAASAAAHEEPSHRCNACGGGIENDLRRKLNGSGEIGGWRTNQWGGGGEYRFHCSKCNVDLCSSCYDRWKLGRAGASGAGSSAAGATQGAGSSLLDVSDSTGAVGGAAIHPLECSFTIEAPITNSWGGSSYGPGMPPPPPVNRHNRRGPWG